MTALVVHNEGDDARTRAENDELRALVNNLQAILNFKFSDDVMSGFDQFEREVRQYHASTIDEDTMSGVILGALSKKAPTRRMGLCQPSRSVYRLDSYNKMLVDIRARYQELHEAGEYNQRSV